ncbi:transposase [Streptomyces sp. NPDC054770]
MKTPTGLAPAPEHRRAHDTVYGGLNRGLIDIGRLRRSLAVVSLPRAAPGRLVLAMDVSHWLRPDAATSDESGRSHRVNVGLRTVSLGGRRRAASRDCCARPRRRTRTSAARSRRPR